MRGSGTHRPHSGPGLRLWSVMVVVGIYAWFMVRLHHAGHWLLLLRAWVRHISGFELKDTAPFNLYILLFFENCFQVSLESNDNLNLKVPSSIKFYY